MAHVLDQRPHLLLPPTFSGGSSGWPGAGKTCGFSANCFRGRLIADSQERVIWETADHQDVFRFWSPDPGSGFARTRVPGYAYRLVEIFQSWIIRMDPMFVVITSCIMAVVVSLNKIVR